MIKRDTGFGGSTARAYAACRRDVPAALLDALVTAVDLDERDLALDLGCGTGQLAIPLSRRVQAVLALDPEADMLVALHGRAQALGIENLTCVLAGDGDLAAAGPWVGPLAVLGVANALHWMDAGLVFDQGMGLLRGGGALAVISQGPPMWLQDSEWSRTLHAFLREWTGAEVSGHCGTDRAALAERVAALEACGYERVEVVEHGYEAEVDLAYIVGHMRSAMSESRLPGDRVPEFASRLEDRLHRHLRSGPVTERIDATMAIAIAPPR